jgi:DNA-binding transcriptional LysR family regulator
MKANNLTLRQLRAFVAVADHESFVAASKAIGLSQPALSQSVRQIERDLGARLFVRTTRNVHLTGIGMSFLTHARHVLRQVDEMATEMERTIERRRGRIVVACLPSVAWRLMPPLMAESTRLFPETRIVVRDMSMAAIHDAVRSGEVDIGIGSLRGTMVDFSSVVILRDRMHAVFARDDPFAALGCVGWDQLATRPFVSMTEETGIRQILDDVATTGRKPLTFSAEVSGLATLMGLVERGAGVTVVPGLALPRAGHPTLGACPLSDPEIGREIGLIWRRASLVSPEAARLLKALDIVRRLDHVDAEETTFTWSDFTVPSDA